MTINLNINHCDILRIDNCCNFTYYSNQNIVTLFFDKQQDRKYAKFILKRCIYTLKIVETDNNDYPDLPECYKLNVFVDYPIIIQINE